MALAVLTAATPNVAPVPDPQTTISGWEIAAAVGTCIGGLAAGVSAVFSFLSARASRATSRDALEALAVGIRPHLRVSTSLTDTDAGPGTGIAVAVRNESSWPATDLRLEVRYRDGHVTKDSRERIDPGAHPTHGYDVWTVPVKGVRVAGPQAPNPYSGDTVDVVASAVLTYSDERGIARYEHRVRPSTVVGTTPFDSRINADERRIR